MTARMHANTHAVQVMPVIPVNARTRAVARWWPAGQAHGGMLRVHVREPHAVYGTWLVACWTVTFP